MAWSTGRPREVHFDLFVVLYRLPCDPGQSVGKLQCSGEGAMVQRQNTWYSG